ncbi:MAG TPA: hypothetical protein VHN99_05825 [Deinococcales bacterium]|nr:hypothetical protein [Deinococcales bacterium]
MALGGLIALAAGPVLAACPGGDYTLDLGGGVTVQASGLDATDASSAFFDACVDARGWTLQTPRLDLTGDTLSAQGVRLAGAGFSGQAESLAGTADRLTLTGLSLSGRPPAGSRLPGLDPGVTLDLTAASAGLTGSTLTLRGVTAREKDAGGDPTALATGQEVSLEGEGATLNGLSLDTAGAGATAGTVDATGTSANACPVHLDLSRVPGPAALELDARCLRAVPGSPDWVLTGVRPRLYGVRLPFTLPELSVRPGVGLNLPFTLDLSNGLVAGVRDQDLGGGALGTFLYQNVPGLNAFSVGLRGQRDGLNYSVGQFDASPIEFSVASSAPAGPYAAFTLNTGSTLGGPPGAASAQAGGGLRGAQTFDGTRLAGGLEAGLAGQTGPDLANDLYARLDGSLARSETSGPVSARWSAWAAVMAFQPVVPGGDPALAANAGGTLAASWAVGPLSLGANLSLTASPRPAPLAAFQVTPALTLALDGAYRPDLPAPAPGFAGLAWRAPAVAASGVLDFLKGNAWTTASLSGSVNLDVFDGTARRDRLGRPVSWPLVTFTPSAGLDLAAGSGSAGLGVSVGDASLVYTLSVRRSFDASGGSWGFGGGIALR